ncbi:MAG: hypothetical protein V3R57_09260 [Candidatus Bathyarchaeia archaeon]
MALCTVAQIPWIQHISKVVYTAMVTIDYIWLVSFLADVDPMDHHLQVNGCREQCLYWTYHFVCLAWNVACCTVLITSTVSAMEVQVLVVCVIVLLRDYGSPWNRNRVNHSNSIDLVHSEIAYNRAARVRLGHTV